MKICHIALGGCVTAPDVTYGITEDTGGHIAYVLGAAHAQAARGEVTSVEIVTSAFDDPELGPAYGVAHQVVGPSLRITRLSTASRRYLSKEALTAEVPALIDAFLARLADPDLRPDIVHAHFSDAARLARAAKDRFGIPFVFTPHSLGIDKQSQCAPGGRLHHRIAQERAAMIAANALVVSSRDEAERQIMGYGVDVAGQVNRVSPGSTVDATEIRGNARAFLAPHLSAPEKPLILAIARPVARKNLAALARVFVQTPALHTQANLVILAGQHGAHTEQDSETRKVLEDLRRILADPVVQGKAALPASHCRADVAGLYAHARVTGGVFVNPALHEPFGLTLLEAASHRVPVVATCNGGPSDIIGTIGHGLCVEPTSQTDLGDKIRRLLADHDLWTQKSRAAERVDAVFCWENWAGAVATIYGRALAGPRHRTCRPRDFLLACDIDHTLTGSARGIDAFRAWLDQNGARYVVATGRCIIEARRILTAWQLPEPEAFVTSVGSEIYLRGPDGHLRLETDFADLLQKDWHRSEILRVIAATGICMQPEIDQRSLKIGCFGGLPARDLIVRALGQARLPAKVVASHGRFIDILPVNAGKFAALSWVARRLGQTAGDLVVAGDSGNDADMLSSARRAILVGNALAEVAHLAARPNVYAAKGSFAAGVVEGLGHYGLNRAEPRPARMSL